MDNNQEAFPPRPTSEMTNEELQSHIDYHGRRVRALLAGGYFHNEKSSAHQTKYVDPYSIELQRRRSHERVDQLEIEQEQRRAKRLEDIKARRPINPTPEDIPLCSIDSHQKILLSARDCIVTRNDGCHPRYSVYEFDPEDWVYRATYYAKKSQAVYRFECWTPLTQEDIDFYTERLSE